MHLQHPSGWKTANNPRWPHPLLDHLLPPHSLPLGSPGTEPTGETEIAVSVCGSK